MTLRRRLTLLSALAVAVAIALASVIVYALVRDRLYGQIDETLQERARLATVVTGGEPIPLIGPGPAENRPPPLPPGAEFRLPPPPGGDFVPRGQVISANGAVEQARLGGLPVTAQAKQVAAGHGNAFFSDQTVNGTKLRVLTAPAGSGTALQVARPLNEVDATLSNLVLILALVSLGGVALAAGLGTLVARTSLAPAAAVAGAAQEVARTKDLARRIEVKGDDELAQMANSFNAMMEALERSVGAQRQLFADASHELRTPLATLRTNIETLGHGSQLDEAARGQIVSDLGAEIEELSALVGDVVELAREPAPQNTVTEEVRLDKLAAVAVQRTRRRARGMEFEEKLEPSLVRGDPARLDRAISNLLDNAVKWSPEDGRIEIAVDEGRLAVRDHGPGFSPEDLPHAFERFYRADEARGMPGSGLGLAIVQRIAEEHGGSATAANAPGGGAQVELRLPLADS